MSAKSETKKNTTDCSEVWRLIARIDGIDQELFNELSDAFCDFECSWKEHADEYHTS